MFLILKLKGCKIGRFNIGFMPILKREKINIQVIKKNLKIRLIINKAKNIISILFSRFIYYDIIFYAGEKYLNVYFNPDTKYVPISLYSYENSLSEKSINPVSISGNYGVFIDQYLTGHPDFHINKIKYINKQSYFNSINEFLNFLEVKTNKKMIIAAHPKSSYSNQEFLHREVYKYKTEELIKSSCFVVALSSTAINFAIIYKKPIIFYYTDEIKQKYTYHYRIAKFFATQLENKIFNVDEKRYLDFNFNDLKFKEDEYEKYITDYIVSDKKDKNKKNVEIIVNGIDALLNKNI